MNKEKSTLNDHREPTEICKERGWKTGTRIVGDEGYGPTTIEITAIGKKSVLAEVIRDGKPIRGSESSWVFWCRDWKEVPTEALDEKGCEMGKLQNGHYRTAAGSEVWISGDHGGKSVVEFDWLEEGACCDCELQPYEFDGMLIWCCEECGGGSAQLYAAAPTPTA